VVNAVRSATKKEYSVKLGMRVGFIKFKRGQVLFDNLVAPGEVDQMSRTSCSTNFRNNKFNMTGISTRGDEFEDKITYRTSSVRDTISQFSQGRNNRSTFTPGSQKGSHIIAKANPNTIDLKDKVRKPRELNNLVEGKYSKRMQIGGKDMYRDLDVLRNHRQDLVEQATTMKDSIFSNKV